MIESAKERRMAEYREELRKGTTCAKCDEYIIPGDRPSEYFIEKNGLLCSTCYGIYNEFFLMKALEQAIKCTCRDGEVDARGTIMTVVSPCLSCQTLKEQVKKYKEYHLGGKEFVAIDDGETFEDIHGDKQS